VAGAVGGGYAGNEVEKRARSTSSYQVNVRMEDGSVRSFKETAENWRVGDRVRIVNGELTPRG
jgi:outer membrane lipoprotein SlyB